MPSSRKLEKEFKKNVKEHYRKLMTFENEIFYILVGILIFLYLIKPTREKVAMLIISLFFIYLTFEKDKKEMKRKMEEKRKKYSSN